MMFKKTQTRARDLILHSRTHVRARGSNLWLLDHSERGGDAWGHRTRRDRKQPARGTTEDDDNMLVASGRERLSDDFTRRQSRTSERRERKRERERGQDEVSAEGLGGTRWETHAVKHTHTHISRVEWR